MSEVASTPTGASSGPSTSSAPSNPAPTSGVAGSNNEYSAPEGAESEESGGSADPSSTPGTSTPSAEGAGADSGAAEALKTAQAAKAPERSEPRRFRVKVDGQEIEVGEDELVSNYQLRRVSQQRLQDAAMAQRQVQQLLQLVKQDPIQGLQKILSHPSIGGDMKKIATEFLAKQFEREAMDPRDRELMEAKEQIARFEREKQELAQAEEQKRNQQFVQQYARDVETKMVSAVEGAGLPKSQRTFDRIVYYLREGLSRGYELEPKDVIPWVREDYEKDVRELISSREAPDLARLLGDDTVEKIRKHTVAQYKQAQAGEDVPVVTQESLAAKPKVKKDDKPKLTYHQIADRFVDARRKGK